MVPDLRIEEHGRIGELALGRTALVTVAVALAPLTVRGQERRRWSSSRSLSSREQSQSSDRSRSRHVRSRSSDRYRSYRNRSRRQRARSPACRGARCHEISLVVLMTARGLEDDSLPPLTVRDQGRKDGEPDVSSRRVWRR